MAQVTNTKMTCISKTYLNNLKISVDCGKCSECLSRRVLTWCERLKQEAKRSIAQHFITLTYMDEKLTKTPNGHYTLNLKDTQTFFKILRKNINKINPNRLKEYPIKYYIAGEYGGLFERPHYHVIIFNAQENEIQRAWSKGYVHFGKHTKASAAYTMSYISKGRIVPENELDDRIEEFSNMSNGLGSNYIEGRKPNWHKLDIKNRLYMPIEDGKKLPMPRYYKKKIYTTYQLKKIGKHFEIKSIENYQKLNQKQKKEYEENYYKFAYSKFRKQQLKQHEKRTKHIQLQD
jgi:hypothetical protein